MTDTSARVIWTSDVMFGHLLLPFDTFGYILTFDVTLGYSLLHLDILC